MATLINETGNRYGRLVVAGRSPTKRGTAATWECRCDCGSAIAAAGTDLRYGNTTSCGCVRSEALVSRQTRHGHAQRDIVRSPAYRTWAAMRDRCNNPRNTSYAHYGGRGVSVCGRWSEFSAFLEDMGERPGHEYSIDRINSNGNYEPGNCRWATLDVQHANRRRPTNARLTPNQVAEIAKTEGSVSAVARLFGVGRGTIRKIRRRAMAGSVA